VYGLVSPLVVVLTEIVAPCEAVMLDRLAGMVTLHGIVVWDAVGVHV
jgi:hypothetical protein